MVRNAWDALIVVFVLGTIALVFFLALDAYPQSPCDITGVLGAVVPAIAAVGGAAFGVATGVRAGQQAGSLAVAEAKDRAADEQRRRETLQQAAAELPSVHARLRGQVEQFERAARSPRARVDTAGAATEAAAVDDMRGALADLQAAITTMTRG